MMYSIARRFSRLMVLVGCSCCVAACEAVSTDTEALNKELVGKVSVGIKSVENSIPAEQPMEVLFYLKNGTDAAIEILPWGTPMEQTLSADLFVVTKDGEAIPYGGRVVKRPPPGPDDFLTVAAGEKRESVVNLSQGYDVKTAGEYTVVLKASAFLGQADNYIEPVVVEDTVTISRQ